MREVWVRKGWRDGPPFLSFSLCTSAWKTASELLQRGMLGYKWEFEKLLPFGEFWVQIVLPSGIDDVCVCVVESRSPQLPGRGAWWMLTPQAISWPCLAEHGFHGDTETRGCAKSLHSGLRLCGLGQIWKRSSMLSFQWLKVRYYFEIFDILSPIQHSNVWLSCILGKSLRFWFSRRMFMNLLGSSA